MTDQECCPYCLQSYFSKVELFGVHILYKVKETDNYPWIDKLDEVTRYKCQVCTHVHKTFKLQGKYFDTEYELKFYTIEKLYELGWALLERRK